MREGEHHAEHLFREYQGVMSDALHSRSGTEPVKCAMAMESLRSFGRLRLQVTGWSMFPAIHPMDTLHIVAADSETILRGDVVLVERTRRLFVHRVISVSDSNIVTRGDAMAHADPITDRSNLMGRVISISRDGRTIKLEREAPLASKVVSALFRSSEVAARVIARIHGMLQSSNESLEGRVSPCLD